MGQTLIRAALSLLLFATLAGCSALNLKRTVAEEDLGKTRRVGVVSVLGETFNGVSVGTTVFNNEYFKASVAEWGVDQFAADTALALLRSNARFSAQALERTTLSAEQIRADKGKLLWDAAEKQGYDKLVIVRPGVSDNYPFFVPGYGLMERSFFGNGKRCVYAAYVVDVYDVASHQPVAWEWGGGAPCESAKDSDLPFKKQFTDYSDEEKQAMHQRLEKRLSEGLRYSLEKLSLIPTGVAAK